MKYRQLAKSPLALSILAALLLVSGCQRNDELDRLRMENARLKAELAQLKAQQEEEREATSQSEASPTVEFEDIKGKFGESAITNLAKLGVFETTMGEFNPTKPITRAEFARWLVRANNAIWFDQPDKRIRETEGGQASFTDVPPTHPDFRYIQGLANSGIAIGYDETTFKPDQPLTREQMIAIKIGTDKGEIEDFESATKNLVSLEPGQLGSAVPDWSDRSEISPQFIPAFNSQYYVIQTGTNLVLEENLMRNVERTFGAIKAFKPKTPVTRGEAAVCLSKMGDRAIGNLGSRTVEQALRNKALQESPAL
ncbi:MAG TPA: S-layer homology domain-containing protein [Oscillatoriales cyanobacterium M59_W2019_021]|nr:MAG: hypothetical protein D6728_19930 [Cyanobacteria bacterium J055]HIK33714.1 S-layer homology domain-containing protein [Oscillatoriales cyanobacterium M4454_W2019_049]HIK51217.1 S-layer homology domain-containing protein [Oscillatoriales cyanobacterium M59_W2019_021]